jgi:hypothetical protein
MASHAHIFSVWLNICCADRELIPVYIGSSLASIYIAYTGHEIIYIMLSVYLHRDSPVLLFCGAAAGTYVGISD